MHYYYTIPTTTPTTKKRSNCSSPATFILLYYSNIFCTLLYSNPVGDHISTYLERWALAHPFWVMQKLFIYSSYLSFSLLTKQPFKWWICWELKIDPLDRLLLHKLGSLNKHSTANMYFFCLKYPKQDLNITVSSVDIH